MQVRCCVELRVMKFNGHGIGVYGWRQYSDKLLAGRRQWIDAISVQSQIRKVQVNCQSAVLGDTVVEQARCEVKFVCYLFQYMNIWKYHQ